MVNATTHPVHQTPQLATRWITYKAISITTDALMLLVFLLIGNTAQYQHTGTVTYTPDPQQLTTGAALLASITAGLITASLLRRSIRLTTPGALNRHQPTTTSRPDALAAAVSVLVTWALLAFIIVTIPRENWFTPSIFLAVGVTLVSQAIAGTAAKHLISRFTTHTLPIRPRLKGLLEGLGFTIAGALSINASTPSGPAHALVEVLIIGGILSAAVLIALDLVRNRSAVADSDPVVTSLADTLNSANASPTISEIIRSRCAVKKAVMVAMPALIITIVAASAAGGAWPTIAVAAWALATFAVLALIGKNNPEIFRPKPKQ